MFGQSSRDNKTRVSHDDSSEKDFFSFLDDWHTYLHIKKISAYNYTYHFETISDNLG